MSTLGSSEERVQYITFVVFDLIYVSRFRAAMYHHAPQGVASKQSTFVACH